MLLLATVAPDHEEKYAGVAGAGKLVVLHADNGRVQRVPVAACFAGAPWQQRCYLCPALDAIPCYCSLERLIFLQAVIAAEL
jgi:hypothetical protein